MARREKYYYLETIDGDSATGSWLRRNFRKNSLPRWVQGQPNPKYLFRLTEREFRIAQRHRYIDHLRFRTWSGYQGQRPKRDYKADKSEKQVAAEEVGKHLQQVKRIIRNHLALVER